MMMAENNDKTEPLLSKAPRREKSRTGDVGRQKFKQQTDMRDLLHATHLDRDKSKEPEEIVTGMRGDGVVRRRGGTPARMKCYGKLGVDYIAHHKEAHHHRDKVIEYEQATVAKSPFMVAFAQTAATVFDFPDVKQDCLLSLTVSTCVALLSLLFAVDDNGETALQSLTDIGTVVSQGLFFLLGPYLGLCLARWWQMRLDFMGGVWGVVADLNTWAATWFSSGSDADKAARRLMLRYGLAAHMLLFKGARGDDKQLEAMVNAGLLTAREQRQLQLDEAKPTKWKEAYLVSNKEATLGLRWRRIGTGAPSNGRELALPKLSMVLEEGGADFTEREAELKAILGGFELSELKPDDYIEAGGRYYRPLEVHRTRWQLSARRPKPSAAAACWRAAACCFQSGGQQQEGEAAATLAATGKPSNAEELRGGQMLSNAIKLKLQRKQRKLEFGEAEAAEFGVLLEQRPLRMDHYVRVGGRYFQPAELVGGAPSKSQMIFAWVTAFWARALAPGQGGLGTSEIPNACQLAPMVLRRCADGRGAAGGALALVFTQLPLAYVHLLSLLVRFASLVNAITHGANAGNTLSSPVCGDELKAAAAGMPRFQLFFPPHPSAAACVPAVHEQSAAASVTIVLSWLVAVVMYPIMYNGLFTIGVMLSNPLGNNSINFCGSWYQHIMKDEMVHFQRCVDGITTKEAMDAEKAEVMEARKAAGGAAAGGAAAGGAVAGGAAAGGVLPPEALVPAVAAPASGTAATPSLSRLEQLKELKGMLDMQLITQADYESKKAELLSRM